MSVTTVTKSRTDNTLTLTTKTTINLNELFDAIIGSDFADCHFIVPRTVVVDTYNQAVSFKFWKDDIYGSGITPESRRYTITYKELVTAYTKLLQENRTHCGGYSFAELDSPDSCFANYILQYALWNECRG